MDRETKKIQAVINKFPNSYCLLEAPKGMFGSLVYRIIAASSDKIIWNSSFCGSTEDLAPLEWPRYQEGFLIYNIGKATYKFFKESHLAAAHISLPLLENMSFQELKNKSNFKQSLLIKSHLTDLHENYNCKVYRLTGSLKNIVPYDKNTQLRSEQHLNFMPAKTNKVYNIDVEKLMSEDYDVFEKEYLSLCDNLDTLPNINNVRQFILLMRDKLKRYHLSLS